MKYPVLKHGVFFSVPASGCAILCAFLVFTAAVYWPGMRGGFVFDDLVNIVDNPALAIEELSFESLWPAAWSSKAGPLKRPLAMASLALNRYFNGTDAFYYKVTNLAIHVGVGGLLAVLFYLLGKAHGGARSASPPTAGMVIAVAAAGLWLVHPLNLTSVLYVIQRMTSLSALFTVLALIAYLYGRLYVRRPSIGLLVALSGLSLGAGLASLAKETGVLAFVYASVIEVSLLRFRRLEPKLRQSYLALMAMGAIIVLLIGYYLWPWLTQGYQHREFSLVERLLTEARVVMFYLKQIFVPDITALGLFHDDFSISRSLISPFTTLPAVLCIAGALLLALLKRRAWPLACFAILWFLGGHTMESTVLPLELVHEHRNYLPMAGLLYAAVYAVLTSSRVLHRRILAFALAAFTVILSAQTYIRSTQWGDPLIHMPYEIAHHPQSYRANSAMGRLLLSYGDAGDPETYTRALKYFDRASELQPFRQKTLFASIQTHFLSGNEPPRELIESLLDRLERYPFQASETVDVKALMNCQESGVCRLAAEDIQAIFEASVGNPWIHPSAEADLWNLRARFAARTLHDSELAERYVLNAISLQPGDFYLRRNLIQLYIAMGRVAAAREQLDIARHKDRLNIHGTDIEHLDRRLAVLEES